LAIIGYCCDLPAARKLCGHASFKKNCHRCLKNATFTEFSNSHYEEFHDMHEWFVERSPIQHRQNAEAWQNCITDSARNEHVKKTGVRWSELLRLPYFNPIRHLTVDPMHCLFLGIAKWIMVKLWLESGKINTNDLKNIQATINKISTPADIGRIPRKIDTGDGFSGFKADEWKTFFLIYATVTMWDLLDIQDRKILSCFVRACTILTQSSLKLSLLDEAHSQLLSMAKLIEQAYGSEKISPNIHLCLHIAECCMDYGPAPAFWLFSFERLNGILGIIVFIYSNFEFKKILN
jgi:hypothetical protein